jgi:hypothetical protein
VLELTKLAKGEARKKRTDNFARANKTFSTKSQPWPKLDLMFGDLTKWNFPPHASTLRLSGLIQPIDLNNL